MCRLKIMLLKLPRTPRKHGEKYRYHLARPFKQYQYNLARRLSKSRLISPIQYQPNLHINLHIFPLYAGASRLPPRVSASGRKPCGGNKSTFSYSPKSLFPLNFPKLIFEIILAEGKPTQIFIISFSFYAQIVSL